MSSTTHEQPPGLRGQLVRGALGVGGLRLLAIPLALAGSIVLARALGPERYGQYAYMVALIPVLSLPVGVGLSPLMTREVAQLVQARDWPLLRGLLRRADQWVVFGSLLVAVPIASVFLISPEALGIDVDLMLIALLALPLVGFSAMRDGALRGLGRVVLGQLAELAIRPGMHLAIVAMLLFTGTLTTENALGAYVTAIGLGLAVSTIMLRRHQPRTLRDRQPAYDNVAWRAALLSFTLMAGVAVLHGQIAILMLGWLGTDADVAALRVAQSGGNLVIVVFAIVNAVISPHVARLYRANDRDGLKKLFRQSARATVAFSAPVALGLSLFATPILEFVYGDEYADIAAEPLIILALSQFAHVMMGSTGVFLSMAGFERDALVGQVLAVLLISGAAYLLIPLHGATGAAYAVALGLVVWTGIMASRFHRRFGFMPSVI